MEPREPALLDAVLAVHSIQEIEPLLRGGMPFDAPALLRELRAREEAAGAGGRVAEARFLAYMRPVIKEAARRLGILPVGDGTRIDSPQSWIDHAITLPSLLSMFLSARRCRRVLGDHAAERVRSLILDAGWRPATEQHVLALVAVGFAVGDAQERVIARLWWAMHCGKTGDRRHAVLHIGKVHRDMHLVRDEGVRDMALFMLGGTCQLAGRLDWAIDAYRVKLEGKADDVLTRTLLATSLKKAGHADEALEVLEHASLSSARTDAELGAHTKTLRMRAELYEADEQLEPALDDYETVADHAHHLGDRVLEFQARRSVASLLSRTGRHRDAVRAASDLVSRVRAWSDHMRLADAHSILGEVLLAKSDRAAAHEQYDAAFSSLADAKHSTFTEATVFFGLGDTAPDNEAADIFHRVGFQHAEHATDLLTALTLYLPRTRHPDGSVPSDIGKGLLEPAVVRAATTSNWPAYVKLTPILADHLVATRQYRLATGLLREMLENFTARNPHGSDTIRCRTKLAEVLMAGQQGSQEAFGLLWENRELIDGKLSKALVEQRYSEILGTHVRVYDLLIRLLVHTDAPLALPDDRDRLELAFDLHEEAKSRSYLAGISRQSAWTDESLPIPLLEREAELLAAERRLQRSQRRAGADNSRTRFARLAEVRAELAEVWNELRHLSPDYVRLRQGRPIRLPEARDLLRRHAPDEGMALASFFVGQDETTCFILRCDDERPAASRIALTQAELHEAAEKLRTAFNGDPDRFPPVPPLRAARAGQRDHQIAVLDEIGPKLLSFTAGMAGLPLVCIAPHGPLHLLPLHALPVDRRTRLVDIAASTYVPSLSALPHLLARPRTLDPGRSRAFVAGVAAREDIAPKQFEHDESMVAGAGWPTRSVAGVQATPEAVLEGLAGADIAQVTCHGYVDRAEPLASGLILARDGARPTRDVRSLTTAGRRNQVLSVREFAELRAPLQLLVLRACSGASLVQENGGDEFSGLVRALLHGGVSTVVGPAWNVDQRSSQMFLARLYQEWRANPAMPLWRLFWQAQRWMLEHRDDPQLTHLYHWAPFLMVGDWR